MLTNNTVRRRRVMVALAGFGVVFAVTTAPSIHAWNGRGSVSVLTFNQSVRLPGVTLRAGTYEFRLADPITNQSLVVVRDGSEPYEVRFLGITASVVRPEGLPEGRLVTFGEAPAGSVVPIFAWYPSGERIGHRFIYSPTER